MAAPILPTAGAPRARPVGEPPGGVDAAALRRAEAAENFPVALRVLPREQRRHLRAIYDVVRVIDDLGDEAEGDRTALLESFAADLGAVWTSGRPHAAVLARLVPTARACGLDPQPFLDLVTANLADQRISTYRTWADLRAYCALSADPVGRLVLAVFGATTTHTGALSDRVCTALQLLEHCQDVAEDRRRGRVYLPQEDLAACGVSEHDLDTATSSAAVRRLIALEADRAAELLAAGPELVRLLRGWGRVAVAGYVSGGLAVVDALRRDGADVLVAAPRPRRRDVLRHGAGLLAGAARRRQL